MTTYKPKYDTNCRNLFYSIRSKTYGPPLYKYDVDDELFEKTFNNYDDETNRYDDIVGTDLVMRIEEKHPNVALKGLNLNTHQVICQKKIAMRLPVPYIIIVSYYLDKDDVPVTRPSDIITHYQYYVVPVYIPDRPTAAPVLWTEKQFVSYTYRIRKLKMPLLPHLSTTLKKVSLPAIIR